MHGITLISSLTISLLLIGCTDNLLVSYDTDQNFLSFNHPFTDKAIDDVRARAERLCGQRKQVAIQTKKVCSLQECNTNYQCVDKENAIKYGL